MQFTRRLATISIALAVTLVAGCSSDEAVSDGSTATTGSSVDSTVASTADRAETGATSAAGGGEVTDTFADRTVIVNYLLGAASASGEDVDSQCILDLVDQLSDDDAKVLADSFRVGTPPAEGDLSDEGEALGADLPSCSTAATATT